MNMRSEVIGITTQILAKMVSRNRVIEDLKYQIHNLPTGYNAVDPLEREMIDNLLSLLDNQIEDLQNTKTAICKALAPEPRRVDTEEDIPF